MVDEGDGSSDREAVHRFVHTHLLGTVVEVRIETPDAGLAERADATAVATVERLQRVFDVHDEGSELCRWRRGEPIDPSPELGELLEVALEWQRRSGGSFNTATGLLTEAWRRADVDDRLPDPAALAELAASIREPRYDVLDGVPRLTGDGSPIEVNAIAKGFIVDRAVAAALETGPVRAAMVNAGGDLAHRGAGVLRVGIEDPLRPYDNEPPLTSVRIRDQGLATSGGGRRGFQIGGRWYGHVIDPRTGGVVDHLASITVVAADCATADVLATVAGAEEPPRALALVAELGGHAALVVDRDGRRWPGAGWAEIEAPDAPLRR